MQIPGPHKTHFLGPPKTTKISPIHLRGRVIVDEKRINNMSLEERDLRDLEKAVGLLDQDTITEKMFLLPHNAPYVSLTFIVTSLSFMCITVKLKGQGQEVKNIFLPWLLL